MAEPPVLDWRLSQVFGGDKPPGDDANDADIVSAVEFDETGEFLAAGDRSGRVVLFEREDSKGAADKTKAKKGEVQAPRVEYKFYTEFQSHESEFDYLKSLEIEEKINKIRFLRRNNGALFLLSTNDKTIKLWKVYQKKMLHPVAAAAGTPPTGDLAVPKMSGREVVPTAVPRRVFANAHAYHINSISASSDQETFISADDLRINLWNLSNTTESFNIVDIKPANMEELSEVITSAEFHPTQCHEFVYSSSKGMIKMGDLRAAALCDKQSKVFQEEEDPSTRSFFSEIISSISDVKYSHCGRYIISRDYLTVKLWDVNMEKKPVKTVKIHEHLRAKLCDLYENDSIFDKFECAINYDSTQLVTGSYSRQFHIYDVSSKAEIMMHAAKVQQRVTSRKPSKGSKTKKTKEDEAAAAAAAQAVPENPEFNRKALHVAFHPRQNILAVAAHNNLFLYASP